MTVGTAWRQKNVRVVVTGGWYRGQSGCLIRPDGTLHGQPGWLVKLDGRMSGAFVETKHFRKEDS